MGALRRKASSSLAGPLAAQRRERTGEPGAAAAAAAKNSAVTLASAVDDSHHVPATRHGDVAGLIGVVVPFGSMESYDRLRLIGEGACGAVFRARHVATGETVVVKIAHKNGGGGGGGDEALLREAEMLAACVGNPAVVRLREVARHPETSKLHLVMDYVGPSLADLLTHRLDGALTEAEARGVMRQLLAGVGQMHARGVIHRDIKPGNVLVGAADGRVRICDLGLGGPASAAPPRTQLVGTLWYMSPEQYLGGGEYGPAVDMWALGCVMAELLTGETLFPADTEYHQVVLVAGVLGVADEKMDGLPLGVTTRPSQLRRKVPEEKLSPAGFDRAQRLVARDMTAVAAWQRRGRHGGDSAGELAAGGGVELGGGGYRGGGDSVTVVQGVGDGDGGGDGIGRGRKGSGFGPYAATTRCSAATAAVSPDPRLSAGSGGGPAAVGGG
uniref:[RNA-polymerase]-subunit kinase n=1 Tax=Oryza rufipogon TaxID=4529 RepID=A0A0E0MYD2_ORYRU